MRRSSARTADRHPWQRVRSRWAAHRHTDPVAVRAVKRVILLGPSLAAAWTVAPPSVLNSVTNSVLTLLIFGLIWPETFARRAAGPTEPTEPSWARWMMPGVVVALLVPPVVASVQHTPLWILAAVPVVVFGALELHPLPDNSERQLFTLDAEPPVLRASTPPKQRHRR